MSSLNSNNSIQINARRLEKRIKSRSSVKEFFMRKYNKHFFMDSVFNRKFIIQLLNRDKDLIPSSSITEMTLGRLKNCPEFNKIELINYAKRNIKLRRFLPDDCDPNRIERTTILNVSFLFNKIHFLSVFLDH